MDVVAGLLQDQHGVVARRQLLDSGLAPHDLDRMVRRRELSRVHPGVYVQHTGPMSWLERAWAAVLFSWPAALTHESAMRAVEGPGRRDRDDTEIHVAVARSRHLTAPRGVRIHRTAHLGSRVQWNLGPPRIRYEHAILDVAAAATDVDAIAVLADTCGSRRSTAERIVKALGSRPRQSRRSWLVAVLDDVANGFCSVLEQGYLQRVERPHGLPTGRRQAMRRQSDSAVLQDVSYDEHRVVVELDGRLFHASVRQRDRDLDRDLHTAVDDDATTLRLGWGQVFERPCGTAGAVARLLQRRGWAGDFQRCSECG